MARMTPAAALAALALALLAGLAPAVRTGVILQPASASTPSWPGTPPERVINQSGLSAGYTSGVTDFDAYLAGDPKHNGDPAANIWTSAAGRTTGNFDFALGGTFTLESFALWNWGGGLLGNVRGFELLASDDASFSSTTSLGTFTAAHNKGPTNATSAEVFTFSPTSAAFVRMVITSNWGGTTFTNFGEAAFEVQTSPTAVPEPGSLALLAAGGLGLLGYARRQRRQKRQPE